MELIRSKFDFRAKQGYMSIAQFCAKGNKLEEGRELLIELSIKNHVPATLISWNTLKDDADKNNFGFYHNSKVEVEFLDKSIKQQWNVYTFSMTYIKLQEGDKK